METNVFMDKSIQPDDSHLAHVLGENATFWEAIKQHIVQKYGDVNEEWKFYNTKSGWTLKVLLKKRNLFFFRPLQGFFRLALSHDESEHCEACADARRERPRPQ